MNGNITYDGYDLQSFDHLSRVGIIINSIKHTNNPDLKIDIYPIASSDGSSIVNTTYPSKTVLIGGAIIGSSQSDLDDRIDSFKAYFNGKDKNLDIVYSTVTRRYLATANTISIERDQISLYATFEIEFICSEPFGTELVTTSIIDITNHTDSVYNVTPTIGGSAPYQLPVFIIHVNSMTGDGNIQVSNDINSQQIVIDGGLISDSDTIEINCITKSVKVNSVDIDYSGTFLELEPGLNSITYTDDLTTRDINIEAYYYKRYK